MLKAATIQQANKSWWRKSLPWTESGNQMYGKKNAGHCITGVCGLRRRVAAAPGKGTSYTIWITRKDHVPQPPIKKNLWERVMWPLCQDGFPPWRHLASYGLFQIRSFPQIGDMAMTSSSSERLFTYSTAEPGDWTSNLLVARQLLLPPELLPTPGNETTNYFFRF